MAKQSGLGDNFLLQGYDLSGDIGSLDSIASPMSPLTATGIDKSAVERIPGLRDGSMEFMSYFNDAAGASHTRLSTLPTTDVIGTYLRGTTRGNAGAGIVAKQANYDLSRGDDGAATFKTTLSAADHGVVWGEQLTAGKETFVVASPTTSIDGNNYGGSGTTNFGIEAFLQVTALTGTNAVVTIQSSSDNAVGDPFSLFTGSAFTSMTAVGAQYLATTTTQAVERYLRINVTGTFTSVTLAVIVCRHLVAWNF
jgi:hypothetical protein